MQTVVRTYATSRGYFDDKSVYSSLSKSLNDGWKVLFVNKIGDRELEYILEKPDKPLTD